MTSASGHLLGSIGAPIRHHYDFKKTVGLPMQRAQGCAQVSFLIMGGNDNRNCREQPAPTGLSLCRPSALGCEKTGPSVGNCKRRARQKFSQLHKILWPDEAKLLIGGNPKCHHAHPAFWLSFIRLAGSSQANSLRYGRLTACATGER